MIIGRSCIKSIKSYTHEIGLRKSEWVKVFVDFVISNLRYGFSIDDYVVKGNGYTLSFSAHTISIPSGSHSLLWAISLS